MRLVIFGLAVVAAACSKSTEAPPAPEITASPSATSEPAAIVRLEPLWIASGFDAPEGVALAPDGNYFISNVAGEGGTKDGVGWVSKLSPEGVVVAEKFIEGLDEPKGMAVHEGNLYVADVSMVRIYDAATGAALDGAEIDGAKFLNDVTVWQDDVFVSDSGTGRIWRFTGTSIDLWREGDELRGVNGLTGDGDRMYVSTMSGGDLFEATTDGGWRKIATGMADADGVGLVPGGGFLVSAWPGEIHYVAADGAVTSILNTRAEGILQNDLTMFGDVVIVPNWEPGTVTAWRAVR